MMITMILMMKFKVKKEDKKIENKKLYDYYYVL